MQRGSSELPNGLASRRTWIGFLVSLITKSPRHIKATPRLSSRVSMTPERWWCLSRSPRNVPAICLALGGPGIFVDSSCGILIDAAYQIDKSIQTSLSAAMIELADNPSLRARLAMNCSA